jgi:NAD(P)-dependent dehydrogenase (short-subunit alcohol dehydrogenase family)
MASAALAGRHALVTGAGRGIGRAVAAALTASGARVTAMGRSYPSLQAVAAAGEASFVAEADVTEAEQVAEGVRRAEAALGPVDILVANAGAAHSGPFRATDADAFKQMLDVNLMGVVHASHAVLPGMTERGAGRIVAIASTAALKGYAYVTAYAAAKHAVLGLVRSLAVETASTGVTVNAVCPGFTETDLVNASLERIQAKTGRSREEALAELTRHNPQRRLVQPSEVADAVVWLASPGARSVTGQAIVVAGGEV